MSIENIHPLLVHFPIAFLGFYAILEILRLPLLTKQSWYFPVKTFLVTVGALAVWPTVLAGKLMEEQFEGTSIGQVVEVHAAFAIATALLFSVIALCYVIEAYNRSRSANSTAQFRGLRQIAHKLVNSPLIILAAVIGFIALSITGGLGASMVFGPDSEPFSHFVYSLFF